MLEEAMGGNGSDVHQVLRVAGKRPLHLQLYTKRLYSIRFSPDSLGLLWTKLDSREMGRFIDVIR